ncbi:hypothetical protein M8J76_011546 [Diaphorina citri]|nr:hypothetical protein M8J76_011546 [Diaphorina citri]
MAPWPEQGNELKSIDKVNEIRSSSFDETQHQPKTDPLDDKGKPGKVDDSQDPQVLGGLDEGQLKALLDEAITYKNPKDREFKSELFKELLQEVEADDKADTSGGNNSTGGSSAKNPIHSATSSARFNRNHRRQQQISSGRHISERNKSGGSLQNLVQAYSSELEAGYTRRRGGGRNNLRGSNSNVSARQREGGSLPSNVNHVQGVSGPSTSLFDEYKRSRDIIPTTEDKVSSESGLCTDYSSSTNTHSRKTSSTWGDEEGIEMEELRGGGRTYTSRATLEVCTNPTTGGDDVNETSTDVDAPVMFPLKTKSSPSPGGDKESYSAPSSSLQLSTSYNSVRCLANTDGATPSTTTSTNSSSTATNTTAKSESSTNLVSTLSIPPQRERISIGSDNKLTPQTTEFLVNSPQVSMLLTARDYHSLTPIPHTTFHFSEPLHAYSSGFVSSGDKCKPSYDENGNALNQTDRKKVRRHKAKNEKNTYLAETVDGFRGYSELHELLLFIENEPGSKKKNKMTQQKKKTKDDSEQPKKRKGKEKLTKCNSLEEISKTKLEDLTSTSCHNRLRPKKQVTLDDEELGWHHEDDSNSISADEALGRKRMKDVRVRDRDKDRERERKTDDETEFRLVQTKKHRRRKRRSSHNEQISQADVFRTARSSPDRNHHHHHSHHRTSSMPPSDRSDCSDLDSVHSLPVTTSRRGTTPSSGQDVNSPSGHSRSSSGSYAEASAGFTPSGGEMNNNSVGKGKHTESSAGLTPGGAEMNNNSVGNNSVGKGKHPAGPKQKSASCHSSSISVHEPGLGPTPLTQSTPNSTINLAANNINLAANAANVSGRRHTATRSCSPETKPNGPTHRDAQTKDWHKSGPRRASITNVNSNSTSEPLVNGSLEPPGHRQPLCNGEPYESVTLCLNNNKHRAPSPPPNCDVFVEFNLPPPPCPSAPQVNPVDVTVEKTVIIRSQHCVSESVSLIIPPPSSSLTNPTPNHAHPPANPTPVNHWTVTNSTPSHASHGTVANTTVNHAQHPVPTNPTAVNHASQASLTDPTRASHAHHPAPANPTSHAPTNPTKR